MNEWLKMEDSYLLGSVGRIDKEKKHDVSHLESAKENSRDMFFVVGTNLNYNFASTTTGTRHISNFRIIHLHTDAPPLLFLFTTYLVKFFEFCLVHEPNI